MRFMSIVKSSEDYRLGPPPQALMEAIGRLGEEATKAGLMVDMGGLLPTAAGFRIRLSGGKLTVTDGPFTRGQGGDRRLRDILVQVQGGGAGLGQALHGTPQAALAGMGRRG